MKLRPDEQRTVDTYNQIAERWAAKNRDPKFWVEELSLFQRHLPSGRIVEIGTGGGRDIPSLLEAGYEYIGTDASSAFIRQLRHDFPPLRFLEQNVYHLNFPREFFDGFWACAVLLHIPSDRIDRALTSIRRIVRPGGVGFISLKEGQGEGFEDEEYGQPRYFSYYTMESFTEVAHRNGLAILETTRKEMIHVTWLGFIVRRD